MSFETPYNTPRNVQIEYSDKSLELRCIASLFAFPDYITTVTPDFFTDENKEIFLAMQKAYAHYGVISSEAVMNFYHSPLPPSLDVIPPVDPKPLLDRLAFFANRRLLRGLRAGIERLEMQPFLRPEDILDITRVTPYNVGVNASIFRGITEFAATLNSGSQYVSTGFHFLDYMFGGGWSPGSLGVIIAEPGTGKTAFVCNSMLRMALDRQVASYLQSIEMAQPKIINRLISVVASVDGLKIKSGNLTEEERTRINHAVETLGKLPIFIDDRSSVSIYDIIQQIKVYVSLYGIKVAFIDYLQLISGVQDMSEDYGEFAQLLRQTAREHNITIVVLSQQNRTHQGIHSIFGSGRVGHSADFILELTTADKNNTERRMVEFTLHKNREGPTGVQTIVYTPAFTRFES